MRKIPTLFNNPFLPTCLMLPPQKKRSKEREKKMSLKMNGSYQLSISSALPES